MLRKCFTAINLFTFRPSKEVSLPSNLMQLWINLNLHKNIVNLESSILLQSVAHKSCKISWLLWYKPARNKRLKSVFSLVLSVRLASLSFENWLKIDLMYLFVYNKIRSKISFVIKQFKDSSSVLAFFAFGQTNGSWHKIFSCYFLICLLIGFSPSILILYSFKKKPVFFKIN